MLSVQQNRGPILALPPDRSPIAAFNGNTQTYGAIRPQFNIEAMSATSMGFQNGTGFTSNGSINGTAGSTSFYSQFQVDVKRARALRRWKKIRDRIMEVVEERKAGQRTGWSLLVKHIKNVNELEAKRHDLYRRYGFEGLKPGGVPNSNPMSLYPAKQYPTLEEPEISDALRPIIRDLRVLTTHRITQLVKPRLHGKMPTSLLPRISSGRAQIRAASISGFAPSYNDAIRPVRAHTAPPRLTARAPVSKTTLD